MFVDLHGHSVKYVRASAVCIAYLWFQLFDAHCIAYCRVAGKTISCSGTKADPQGMRLCVSWAAACSLISLFLGPHCQL